MAQRLSIIIIIALFCSNLVSNYLWVKKVKGIESEMTAMIRSNQDVTSQIQERLDSLCKRLSKIEKAYKEVSSEKLPFKIVDDDG